MPPRAIASPDTPWKAFQLPNSYSHSSSPGWFREVADDRPVTITAIDHGEKIRAALPELRGMVREGLILLLEAELVANQPLDS